MTCVEGTTTTAVHVNTGIQRTLRTSPRSKNEEEDYAKDVALETAEEKLMMHEHDDGDDEEIESCDESGKPVVDTQKLERRMMTVALVKSVVETSGGGANVDSDAGADQKQPHTYGLRKRNSKGGRDSPEDEPSRRRARSKPVKRTHPVKKRPVPAAVAVPTPIAPRIGDSSSAAMQDSGPMNEALQPTHQVPNPLLQSVNPPLHPAMQLVAPVSTVPLPPVPCPLPSESDADCQPDAAFSGGRMHEIVAPVAARRGRIFSIDIDPEGLEFPDMSIDIAMQPIHPSRTRSASIEQGSQADSSSKASVTFKPQSEHKDSLDVSLPSSARGRAMSFEFFSFGINADEPLPPVAPEFTITDAPAFTRPRGDSIIFEPDSFKDGGILEEHALLKTRAASIDLAAPEELALMNTPGFAPAAPPTTTVPGKPSVRKAVPPPSSTRANHSGPPKRQSKRSIPTAFSHADRSTSSSAYSKKSTDMATLPSTLNTTDTPSHTTFQMDLLNKDGRIGIYLPEARKARIAKFHSKRKMRIWRKRIKYDCRKKLADSRPRIKGRFVKRSDMDDE